MRQKRLELKLKNKYTKFEIAEFVCGYTMANESWYSVDDIESILRNALSMLRDEQDGIEATFKQREKMRFQDWGDVY